MKQVLTILCILGLLVGCNERNVNINNGILPDEIAENNGYRSRTWKYETRWVSIADQYETGPNYGLKVVRFDRGGSISIRIVNNEVTELECYRTNDFTVNWDNAKNVVSVLDIVDVKFGLLIQVEDGDLVVVEWANQSPK